MLQMKNNTIYLYFKEVYSHQTLQGGGLWQGATTQEVE